MFEEVLTIHKDTGNIYALKTLMLFTKKETINAVAMEMYLQDAVPQDGWKNKLETPTDLLELARTHNLMYGSYREFPVKWEDPDYMDLDNLKANWIPKAIELIDRVLPGMQETW